MELWSCDNCWRESLVEKGNQKEKQKVIADTRTAFNGIAHYSSSRKARTKHPCLDSKAYIYIYRVFKKNYSIFTKNTVHIVLNKKVSINVDQKLNRLRDIFIFYISIIIYLLLTSLLK